MRVSFQLLEFRQVLAQTVVGRPFVAFAVSVDTVMPTRQRHKMVMHLANDTHIRLQMTITFVVLYLVFVGFQCFTSYQPLTPSK